METQLQDSLAKYDADIGGRHRDMEHLAEEFRLLNSQKETLEVFVFFTFFFSYVSVSIIHLFKRYLSLLLKIIILISSLRTM